MASHLTFITLMFSLFLLYPTAYAQDSGSNMECGIRLLPLIPCAPFVQGSISSPGTLCCDNLIDVYDQQPICLCVFLSDPIFLSLPINQTLALQLPLLCKLAMNLATCSGTDVMTPESPESPPSPNPGDAGTNSPAAEGPNLATPESPRSPIPGVPETNSSAANSTILASPPFSIMGYGFSKSDSTKMKTGGDVLAVVLAYIFVGLMSCY